MKGSQNSIEYKGCTVPVSTDVVIISPRFSETTPQIHINNKKNTATWFEMARYNVGVWSVLVMGRYQRPLSLVRQPLEYRVTGSSGHIEITVHIDGALFIWAIFLADCAAAAVAYCSSAVVPRDPGLPRPPPPRPCLLLAWLLVKWSWPFTVWGDGLRAPGSSTWCFLTSAVVWHSSRLVRWSLVYPEMRQRSL